MSEQEKKSRFLAKDEALDLVLDLGAVAGVLLIFYGVFLLSPPLALAFGGLAMALGCIAASRARAGSRPE
jgi:hypothetical protein